MTVFSLKGYGKNVWTEHIPIKFKHRDYGATNKNASEAHDKCRKDSNTKMLEICRPTKGEGMANPGLLHMLDGIRFTCHQRQTDGLQPAVGRLESVPVHWHQ